ncbi:MAG: TonB-dependent receptor [Woeseiaceae bacterium]|nr:TonB-dependent receptor [Woeseiaceae bacterium]
MYSIYGDLAKEFDDESTLKFQLFFDQQDADGSLATGFAAVHEMDVFEARLSWNRDFQLSDSVGMDFYTMLSHREYNSILKENFLQGYLVLDRMDLSVGATPGDIVATPFIDPGTPWESDFDSTLEDTGLAVVTDFSFGDRLSLLLNGRYDDYSARGINNGTFSFGPLGVLETTSEDDFSWSASLSYSAPQGFVPYVTYAEGSEVRVNSNGGVSPGTIASDSITGGFGTERGRRQVLAARPATLRHARLLRADAFPYRSPRQPGRRRVERLRGRAELRHQRQLGSDWRRHDDRRPHQGSGSDQLRGRLGPWRVSRTFRQPCWASTAWTATAASSRH